MATFVDINIVDYGVPGMHRGIHRAPETGSGSGGGSSSSGRYAVHTVTKSGALSKTPTENKYHGPLEARGIHMPKEHAESWKAKLESMNPGRKYAVVPHSGEGRQTSALSGRELQTKRISRYLSQPKPGYLKR